MIYSPCEEYLWNAVHSALERPQKNGTIGGRAVRPIRERKQQQRWSERMKKKRSNVKVRMRGGVMRRSRQKEKIEKKKLERRRDEKRQIASLAFTDNHPHSAFLTVERCRRPPSPTFSLLCFYSFLFCPLRPLFPNNKLQQLYPGRPCGAEYQHHQRSMAA